MKAIWRWLVVFIVFAWIAGIAPVIIYLRDWKPPTGLFTPGDAVALYVMAPLELLLVAAFGLIIVVPLACLIEWAIGESKSKPIPLAEVAGKTPQEKYVEGEIDIDELEHELTRKG